MKLRPILKYTLIFSPFIAIAALATVMVTYNNTVSYSYSMNKKLTLELLETKYTKIKDSEYTLSFKFLDEQGKLHSEEVVRLFSDQNNCHDFYKNKIGQKFDFYEKAGVATSFFGSHDFSWTEKEMGLSVLVCQKAFVNAMREYDPKTVAEPQT